MVLMPLTEGVNHDIRKCDLFTFEFMFWNEIRSRLVVRHNSSAKVVEILETVHAVSEFNS
jgi:hypothetical protein